MSVSVMRPRAVVRRASIAGVNRTPSATAKAATLSTSADIANHFASGDVGVTSPYPTVEAVTTEKYTASVIVARLVNSSLSAYAPAVE